MSLSSLKPVQLVGLRPQTLVSGGFAPSPSTRGSAPEPPNYLPGFSVPPPPDRRSLEETLDRGQKVYGLYSVY